MVQGLRFVTLRDKQVSEMSEDTQADETEIMKGAGR